jgi:peptide/nickel transport system substrate-binding protein
MAVTGTACVIALAACGSAHSPKTAAVRVQGGTATLAEGPGDVFSYIFPILSDDFSTSANLEYSEYLMWRPLYWYGGPGSVLLNPRESLAYPARVTHPTATTTLATIKLKPYRWSDGKPVTTRDVQFWINLLKAEKLNWWDYLPGQFPENVASLELLSPTTFSMTFDHDYGSTWIYNQLSQIIPIPQQAWDKTSAAGPVGNYDLSPSGAKAVGKFLLAQNKDLSSYATNPLWQVVDGPWRLSTFTPATGDATFVRNTSYSGPATGSIHTLRVMSFTSDAAEFDSLLSGSGPTYGYVPYNDAAEISRVEANGYQVEAWPEWGITFMTLNYGSPQVGAILKQLYVRQAMQHLINQAAYIRSFFGGYAYPTYGPVPLLPKSPWLTRQQQVNPYPYDPAAATELLKAHGWTIVPNGTDTCARPGTAANECGAGIAAGARLSFTLEYADDTQAYAEEAASMQSAFSRAGIHVVSSGASFDTVIGDDVPCTKSGCWELNFYGQGWYYSPAYSEPDGSVMFASDGVDNVGGYSSTTADALISKLPSGSITAFDAYENYLAKQLPLLWLPQPDAQISAVSDKLEGVFPQDPQGNVYPEDWYFVK